MTTRSTPRLGGLRVALLVGVLGLSGCASTDGPETAGSATSTPSAASTSGPEESPEHGGEHDHGHEHEHGDDGADAHLVAGDGRRTDAAGYSLEDLRWSDGAVSFQVATDAGDVVTDFATTHGKPLHMFVYATDLSEFRHVHPEMDDTGEWSLDLAGLAPGEHRVVVEFAQESSETGTVMLGGGIDTGGSREPRPLPPSVDVVEVDGYTVAVSAAASGGGDIQLDVAITEGDGTPAELLPYLDSWAHSALVHARDLALTHLHPRQEYEAGAPSPPRLSLAVLAPRAGKHRLVVEFRTSTGLHQAELTLLIT